MFKDVPVMFDEYDSCKGVDSPLGSYTHELCRQISGHEDNQWWAKFQARYSRGELCDLPLGGEWRKTLLNYCLATGIIKERDEKAERYDFSGKYEIVEKDKFFSELYNSRREEQDEILSDLQDKYDSGRYSIKYIIENDLGLDGDKFWIAVVWLVDYVESIRFPYVAEPAIDTIMRFIHSVEEIENQSKEPYTAFDFSMTINGGNISSYNNNLMYVMRDALRDYLEKYENEQPLVECIYIDGTYKEVPVHSAEYCRLHESQDFKGTLYDAIFNPQQRKVSKNLKAFQFKEYLEPFLNSHYEGEIMDKRRTIGSIIDDVIQELCRLFGFIDDNGSRFQLKDTLKGINTTPLKTAKSEFYTF